MVDNYDIGKPDDEAGEELEGEVSPTVTTVDVTPRPSVAPTYPDALVYPYSPRSRPSSSAEADSGPNSPTSVLAKLASVSSSSARGAHVSRASPGRYSSNGREDVEFSSDDDSYEFDNIDYSEGDDGEENIEISSARFSMTSGGTGNYFGGHASYGPPEGYRDREGSVATLRIKRPDSGGDRDRPPPIFTSPFASTSAVVSPSSSVLPSFNTGMARPPSVSATPTSPSADPTPSGMDADFDFAYITSFGADLSADPSSSVPDFVRPRRVSAMSLSGTSSNRETSGRKDSIGKSLFFSWLSGRRPSTATVASSNSSNMFIHDDTFAQTLLKWGGEGYKEQRKDWTIRREVHPVSSSTSSATTSSGNKEEKLKRITTSSTVPRMSTATNITAVTSTAVGTSHGFLSPEPASSLNKERETSHSHTKSQSHDTSKDSRSQEKDHSHKEREKERLRRSTMHWRGMPVGSEEVWGNDLLGKFAVFREEVGRGAKGELLQFDCRFT